MKERVDVKLEVILLDIERRKGGLQRLDGALRPLPGLLPLLRVGIVLVAFAALAVATSRLGLVIVAVLALSTSQTAENLIAAEENSEAGVE